jgi:hypothetical protein
MISMAPSSDASHLTRRRAAMSRPSPLPNRCAPDGTLHAVAARGTLMGNRGGRLHRADHTLGRARWKSRAWISCRLDFKGRHRTVMGDSYTEIFFLDEATAFAAGHRPCFECRRADARAFAAAWARAHGSLAAPSAPEMDRSLHAQRLGPPETVAFGALPSGAIFRKDGAFHVRAPSGAALWSFDGYGPTTQTHGSEDPVEAITPAAIRALLPELGPQSAR